MSLPSVQTMTKDDEVAMRDWIENFRLVCHLTIRRESTRDKAGSLPPASRDYVILSICYKSFLKAKTFIFLHKLNSKNNGSVMLPDYILAPILFPVVCCNGLQGLKMD